jgi:hypothetical protein
MRKLFIYYSTRMWWYIESLSACIVDRSPSINYDLEQEFIVIYNVLRYSLVYINRFLSVIRCQSKYQYLLRGQL